MTELKRYGFFTQSHEDDLGFMASTTNGEFVMFTSYQRDINEKNEIIEMQNDMLKEALMIFEGKGVVSHELKSAIEFAIAGSYGSAKKAMYSRLSQ